MRPSLGRIFVATQNQTAGDEFSVNSFLLCIYTLKNAGKYGKIIINKEHTQAFDTAEVHLASDAPEWVAESLRTLRNERSLMVWPWETPIRRSKQNSLSRLVLMTSLLLGVGVFICLRTGKMRHNITKIGVKT